MVEIAGYDISRHGASELLPEKKLNAGEGRFFSGGRGIKTPGFGMYRSKNGSLVLAAQDCCSRVADRYLCVESARQRDCGLSGLLCLSFS